MENNENLNVKYLLIAVNILVSITIFIRKIAAFKILRRQHREARS